VKTFTPKVVTVFPKAVKARPDGSDSKKKARKRRPKTMMLVNNQEVKREWYVVDAKDQVLGRIASQIAIILRGKHKPLFVPHTDVGDFVIVINASHVILTGNKAEDKLLYRHTGYPGGIKSKSYGSMRENEPDQMFHAAVKTMLPRNKLRARYLTKLKVYGGAEHPHSAQQPKALELLKKA
jgi:large subunit ribosomal protein L13